MAFECIMHYACARRNHEPLQPRSGDRNIAQGGAEGGTLGSLHLESEPCKGDRNAFAPIFMAVL